MPYPANSSQPFACNRILIGSVILYVCAFAVLLPNKSFDAIGAVVVLIVFGIAFPFIAWVATWRAVSLSISGQTSKWQLIILIGYLVLLSVYLVGGPQWIDQHLPSSWAESARTKFFITLVKKLIVFVAVPFAISPGFIFRHAGKVEGLGSNPSALDAIAYSIVVLAISGVTFGVIWARTKNLFAVMLIHAAGDLLPNFAGFVQTWL
jgi:membrane protease YdiL (CAAX protease family)